MKRSEKIAATTLAALVGSVLLFGLSGCVDAGQGAERFKALYGPALEDDADSAGSEAPQWMYGPAPDTSDN